jgi:thiosulfate dehydrogenase [quinone] large subunit
MRAVRIREDQVIEDPPFAKALFADTRYAWIWVPLRLWLGWQWLTSGWGKLGNPAWMETGAALQSFWQRAVAIPEQGRPAIAYDWYREFLQFLLEGGHHVWFAKLVVFGELLIGIGLILGALTGIAAFFGVFMNWHFVMAGTASSNALLAAVGLLLVLAWKTAGWWGLDRWLLPLLGTPWQPGRLVRQERAGSAAETDLTEL